MSAVERKAVAEAIRIMDKGLMLYGSSIPNDGHNLRNHLLSTLAVLDEAKKWLETLKGEP